MDFEGVYGTILFDLYNFLGKLNWGKGVCL